MAIKLICSDCNGVLNNVDGDYSKSGWYSTVSTDDVSLYNQIYRFLFASNRRYLIYSWMAGEITYKDINRIIADYFKVDRDYLTKKLIESAKNLELNWNLIDVFQRCRKDGIKATITSNNMDIFSLYTVPANNLNNYFDEIYNSSNIGYLKDFNDFELYKNIAKKYNIDVSEILVIDDSRRILESLENIGFSVYLYNNDTYMNFESALNEMLKI